MKYNPKDATMCLPAGVYDATISAFHDKDDEGKPLTSKSGNLMEVVEFTVYTSSGGTIRICEYITEKVVAWKYGVLAKALDKKDEFEAGTFSPANYIDHNVKLELEVEQYNGQDQNKIKKVLPKGGGPSTTKAVSVPRPQAVPQHARKGGVMDPSEIPF